ncbi:hypothetical protein B0H17DRAFT_1133752 [Mycena rosella]|uniref:Uncharacterized protein n=1 Tax=Mycena rosella TaxID=1033263 RepID=A0AAD7DJ54_MYCRO|nr:hypothetical protein B0H17DRAFT_1133752 [Mycena rosella]
MKIPLFTTPVGTPGCHYSTTPRRVTDDWTLAARLPKKTLYKHPDDVDFVVGVQLEELDFPGTTMPHSQISALIPSLFSFFGVGNSDRFSPGYAVLCCILAALQYFGRAQLGCSSDEGTPIQTLVQQLLDEGARLTGSWYKSALENYRALWSTTAMFEAATLYYSYYSLLG